MRGLQGHYFLPELSGEFFLSGADVCPEALESVTVTDTLVLVIIYYDYFLILLSLLFFIYIALCFYHY